MHLMKVFFKFIQSLYSIYFSQYLIMTHSREDRRWRVKEEEDSMSDLKCLMINAFVLSNKLPLVLLVVGWYNLSITTKCARGEFLAKLPSLHPYSLFLSRSIFSIKRCSYSRRCCRCSISYLALLPSSFSSFSSSASRSEESNIKCRTPCETVDPLRLAPRRETRNILRC